ENDLRRALVGQWAEVASNRLADKDYLRGAREHGARYDGVGKAQRRVQHGAAVGDESDVLDEDDRHAAEPREDERRDVAQIEAVMQDHNVSPGDLATYRT